MQRLDDLRHGRDGDLRLGAAAEIQADGGVDAGDLDIRQTLLLQPVDALGVGAAAAEGADVEGLGAQRHEERRIVQLRVVGERDDGGARIDVQRLQRSEEHTSELQSLMSTSYAVFSLQKTKNESSVRK